MSRVIGYVFVRDSARQECEVTDHKYGFAVYPEREPSAPHDGERVAELREVGSCVWTDSGTGNHHTACGVRFVAVLRGDGSGVDAVDWCPYCGGPVEVAP